MLQDLKDARINIKIILLIACLVMILRFTLNSFYSCASRPTNSMRNLLELEIVRFMQNIIKHQDPLLTIFGVSHLNCLNIFF